MKFRAHLLTYGELIYNKPWHRTYEKAANDGHAMRKRYESAPYEYEPYAISIIIECKL
jgi:hypothetical protein